MNFFYKKQKIAYILYYISFFVSISQRLFKLLLITVLLLSMSFDVTKVKQTFELNKLFCVKKGQRLFAISIACSLYLPPHYKYIAFCFYSKIKACFLTTVNTFTIY